VIGEALQQYGASVRLASSAAEALADIKAESPDILVSDIAMPKMDGYELLNRIRSDVQKDSNLLPGVAVTAYAGAADKLKSLRAGYQAHLGKPVAIDD
jgi:CheY-like chemotaxis protein